MTSRSGRSPATGTGDPDYESEIRFGVVMYGGVSLAIYINGVTNEIYELACSTPREGITIDPAGEPFTRTLYRRLSWLAGNAGLRAAYAARICESVAADPDHGPDPWERLSRDGCSRTRFAVDVVAGTSAGGINGIFLAKALANGEQFGPLKDLWINEGDFELLINDRQSYAGIEPPLKLRSPPTSLLNSDRMYAKLYDAMRRMAPIDGVTGADGQSTTTSPLADEIDLYVTTTDVRGSPVPLRLFDKVVYERRYKQSYHFSFPNGISNQGNDFAAPNTAFLAFAARCTSSFPFAFEPMSLAAVERLGYDGGDDGLGIHRWNAFFPNLPPDEVRANRHVHRAFGDGGYLDNKPFSYVVDQLARRYAAVPLERKLIYVEPAPEHITAEGPNAMPVAGDEPDVIENSLAALTTIPQYETIREDLQAILQRNRRVERIERVVRLGQANINATEAFTIRLDAAGKVPLWSKLTLDQMRLYYGEAFLPYQWLRVYAATDAIADRIGAQLGIDAESDRQYALRALVRAWRESRYDAGGTGSKGTLNAFLDEFDLDYRLRRLAFLVRKIDVLLRLADKRVVGDFDLDPGTSDRPPALSDEERETLRLLDGLNPPYDGLYRALLAGRVAAVHPALRALKRTLYDARHQLLAVVRAIDVPPVDAPPVDDGPITAAVFGFTTIDALMKALAPVLDEVLEHAAAANETLPELCRRSRSVDPVGPDRMTSTMRTLQEIVVLRAGRHVDPAAPIGGWLAAAVDALRVNADRRHGPARPSMLEVVSGRAWELLGQPTLVPLDLPAVPSRDTEGRKAEPHIEDVTVDGVRSSDRLAMNGPEGTWLRWFLAFFYLRFDSYDQMSFPLYYDTGTGEPSTVEVVRISPVDAVNLIDETNDPQKRKKLAGTALANFGAFLDRRWRTNDIMWGRLDGAERLIEAVLPMNDTATRIVRKELVERAHRDILETTLTSAGRLELADLLVKALDEVADDATSRLRDAFACSQAALGAARREADAATAAAATTPTAANATARKRALAALDAAQVAFDRDEQALYRRRSTVVRTQIGLQLDQLSKSGRLAQSTLAGVLGSLLDPAGLMRYVRDTRRNDPEPDPRTTLRSAARAVTVTGNLLQGIAKKRGVGTRTTRWLARTGLALQAAIAVSIPDAIGWRIARHWIKVLYLVEAVFLAAAFLFGSADMRTLATSALATTFAVHLLTRILGDVLGEVRNAWAYGLGMAACVVVLGFAGLGLLMFVHQGVQQGLCWTNPAASDDRTWAAAACERIAQGRSWWNRMGREAPPDPTGQNSAKPSR